MRTSHGTFANIVNLRAYITNSHARPTLGVLAIMLYVLGTPMLPARAMAATLAATEGHEENPAISAADEPAPTTAEDYSEYEHWSALQIMQEAQRRHEQFPYVYEEQTMVLMDAQGNRSVRQCRRFSRTEGEHSAQFLLIFDDPEEIRGVALLAKRDANGKTEQGVYLPAFGAEFKQPAPDTRSGHFLGTDFSIEDLTNEVLDEHRYVRGRDQLRENVAYFVIDAYPSDSQVERDSGYGLRRHLVRKDIFMIVQTDFFDTYLRFMKRITHHDLKRVSGESWRANMIIVSDEREKHRTLLKIDRRIYSRDYVPAEIFERKFLLDNGYFSSLGDRVAGRLSPSSRPGQQAVGTAHSDTNPKRSGQKKKQGKAMIDSSVTAKSTGQ